MDVYAEYRMKLRTADQAAALVKSGDWVDYASNIAFPVSLDAALARRRDELKNVKVRGNLLPGPIQIVECDPEMTHFVYNTWHCSGYERKLCDKGRAFFTPMLFRNLAWYYKNFLKVNVAMVSASPMDRHGYFNLGGSLGLSKAIIDCADIVIIEVNEAAQLITQAADPEANIIFGAGVDEELGDKVVVTIIATGFNGHVQRTPEFDMGAKLFDASAFQASVEENKKDDLNAVRAEIVQPETPVREPVMAGARQGEVNSSRMDTGDKDIPEFLRMIRSRSN